MNSYATQSNKEAKIVIQQGAFPVDTKVKVTGEAKPGTTTHKYYGQTGIFKQSGASELMSVVWFEDGLATVLTSCLEQVL